MDIEGIKSDFTSIWVAFVEAVVRFWNNRFHKGSEEISYLREQIALLQSEKKELLDKIILPPKFIETNEEEREFKPVTSGRHIPWHEKRRILETNSRNEAIRLAELARENLSLENERSKSTEQLEQELGIRN